MYLRDPPEKTETNQQAALNTTFIITKVLGPSFIEILKPGENSTTTKTLKYRVKIGEKHSCTCKNGKLEKNVLCIHICWTLLKYLKLTVLDSRSWQVGLPFRDLEQLIHEKDSKPEPKNVDQSDNPEVEENSQGREITIDDVCPICQETLLSAQKPVCHCQSCLQNVHIHCIKIWIDHQPSTSEDFINCPMCRCSFSTIKDFRRLQHQNSLQKTDSKVSKRFKHDISCKNCDIFPIIGRLYKCEKCEDRNSDIHLCAACFTNGCHDSCDEFKFKTSKTSQWKIARKRFKKKILPEIDGNSENLDREALLMLDEPDLQRAFDIPADPSSMPLPQHVVNMIPSLRLKITHKLIKSKASCLLCLKKYQVDDYGVGGEIFCAIRMRHSYKIHFSCQNKLFAVS